MRGKHGRVKVQGSMNNGKITAPFCRRVGKTTYEKGMKRGLMEIILFDL
jgi:hypothetical protein